MAAVAETAGTKVEFVAGNLHIVAADVTSVDDGDTWQPGLGRIVFAAFTNSTANPSGSQVNVSWATANNRATVTFDCEAASQSGTVIAMGY